MDAAYPNRDQHAARRHEFRQMLTAMVESAAERDGIELYLSTHAVLGIPVPASLLVTAASGDPEHPGPLPVDTIADSLRGAHGRAAEIDTVTLPSGPAVRCRRTEHTEETKGLGQPEDQPNTVLDFYLPVPNSGAWLLLTFSTPMPVPEIADAQVEMFEAIAASLRWTYTS
ncbi:hypothetical protein [Streptomyces sp. NBRC 109706]|uniref:hypothetical protein n=1 Tax=Streptomyces sp. NBRC 109706 TaxID=1550035 RepID=UPI00131D808E|nr:hypothetical protein [Streptomyces sp. NBRC 109706]